MSDVRPSFEGDRPDDEWASLAFDAYGVKGRLPFRPAEDPAGPPTTWREVGRRVNQKLMQIALAPFDGAAECVKLLGNAIRGLTRQPPKQAATVAIAQELAEVREGKKQAKVETGEIAAPNAEAALSELRRQLRALQTRGIHAEIRRVSPDEVVIAIVSPEKRGAIEATVKKARRKGLFAPEAPSKVEQAESP